ncbi:hypothetical protein HMSSN139_18120 [Paenibacillus sp. HMSSN-139]|jgi:hypothetical protein|nr:hypothetical protein HMSSN139_18120 [Paenibacillus sp. HMSSN-139]
MGDFLVAFVSVMLLGIVIFVKLWWDDGANMRLKFWLWYFGLFFVGALVVGTCYTLAT